MSTIGEKLEALYMLPHLSEGDYLLLEPCMNAYKVHRVDDMLTEKQKELIIVIHAKYFNP